MSPKFSATLQELRQQRGLIDRAITALEIISGERPLPEIVSDVYVTEPRKRRHGPKPRPRKERPPVFRFNKLAQPKTMAPAPVRAANQQSVEDEKAVLEALTRLGNATCDQVMKVTKLPADRAKRAKSRLVARGAVVVKGWARGARWSLPAAKEAP